MSRAAAPAGVAFDARALFAQRGDVAVQRAQAHALRLRQLGAGDGVAIRAQVFEQLQQAGGAAGHGAPRSGEMVEGARGQRLDLSGPAIAEMVGSAMPLSHSQGFLLPDEAAQLRALLTELALSQGFDLICTTGGTGLSARDITPQTTAALLDTPLPGFTQAMLAASLAKTPHAVISRAAAGALGQSIIINLPGSRKAVVENLAAVLPALPHALAKLQGDPADCGG